MKILKKILALTLVFALGIGAGYVSEHPVTENSRFQAFTEKLFQTEVSANALTLHYTLADPAGAGIRPTETTLGTLDTDSSETTRLCNEYENLLRSFSYSRLSRDNQLTLDMLLLYPGSASCPAGRICLSLHQRSVRLPEASGHHPDLLP